MLGTARLLGQTIGAALVALLFGRIAVHATEYALYIAAGFALAAAAISSLRLLQKVPEALRPPFA
jgi:DHA2 family multidrug resistance protein-like MFS transporter